MRKLPPHRRLKPTNAQKYFHEIMDNRLMDAKEMSALMLMLKMELKKFRR